MSADSEVRPPDDSWVVALHSSEHGVHPSGSGLVIDRQRILTCAHVARRIQDSGCELWVAFPKSKNGPVSRLRVAQEQVVFADFGAEVQDLALLHLRESVPLGVNPVRLRDPAPSSLLAGRWWAFGFPQGDPAGNSAQGTIGEVLASGLLRIDRKSRYGIESGFSGAGVWSPEYRAVVAVITEAEGRRGDGRAIPLPYQEACFPDEQIRGLTGRWSAIEAGDVALSAWGWSLTGDPEAEQHWSPRARGVSIGSEHGYRFQGRKAALQVIKDWLDRDRDRDHRRMLVVTGAPGAGKSAVLGRIVTTADADAVKELPASDAAVRANVGSVACAVHAKGKTALEVATDIARAASAELPKDIDAFPRFLQAALTRQGRRFNVIIDALDEAVSLSEARNIIRKVILPMTETFSDVDARVVAGSRRAGSSGDLLGRYRESSRLVDLDDLEFYAQEDLAAYALATLQLAGDKRSESERDGKKPNPYADARIAGPVAARIAELSAGNFLVAGLTARTRGIADDTPKSPEQLSFSPRISDVMDDYLELVPETAGIDGRKLLTALAFAESPGLPVSLWCEAIQALGYGNVTEVQLVEFTQTRAASFLIESYGQDGNDAVFRLFHQALNDALVGTDDPGLIRKVKERVLTRAFLGSGRDAGWEYAPTYLLRSLPAHAARAGLVDDLLADNVYPLHADLRRLLQVTGQAVSPASRNRARLLGMTPDAATVGPPDRAAMFGVTEALDGLGAAYRSNRWQAPYRAQWAVAKPRDETIILDGHGSGVKAICVITVDGRSLLATGSIDKTVRLWDPANGTQTRILKGHQRSVYAMCAITVDGRSLLATASTDETIRLWDPVTGQAERILETHQLRVNAICAIAVDDRSMLAVGSSDGTVRLWDPATGAQTLILKGHQREVMDVCIITVDGRTLLATRGNDETVQLSEPATGTQTRILKGDSKGERHHWVKAICVITVDGRTLLAASRYRKVRLWDPVADRTDKVLTAHRGGQVEAMCAVTVGGRRLLATVSDQQTVRLWDPASGTQTRIHEGRRNSVQAICAVDVDGRSLLATCSDYDRTVRLWDPATFPATGTQTRAIKGHQREVKDVCAVDVDGRSLLATCSDEAVLLWDPITGTQAQAIEGHQGWFQAICAVAVDGRMLIATSSSDETVRVWDLDAGVQTHILEGHQGWVHAVCTITVNGRTLLAASSGAGTVRLWEPDTGTQVQLVESPSRVRAMCAITSGGGTQLATGSEGGFVRLWNPGTGTQIHTMEGHQGEVTAMCAITVDGKSLLATGSGDKTIRVWDPDTGVQTHILEGHRGWVHAVCTITVNGRTLLATGSGDRTVRLWDLEDGRCTLTVPVHYAALAVTSAANSLAVGLAAGVLVIKFE